MKLTQHVGRTGAARPKRLNRVPENALGFVIRLPAIEAWLDVDAAAWMSLSDSEYKALVGRWNEVFVPLIEADAPCQRGRRAIESMKTRMPAEVCVLNGIAVPRMSNTGGDGPAAYRVSGLRDVHRD